MQKFSKMFNIINIISIILIYVLQLNKLSYIYNDYILLYSKVVTILISVNVIISIIIEFKNKNILIGIINIVFTIFILYIICLDDYRILFIPLIIAILNLIFQARKTDNKLNTITIIVIIIFTIVEVIFASLPIIYGYKNIKNLESALPKLHEQKNLTTYVYKKENKYIYLDDKGNKIAEKDFDEFPSIAFENHYIYCLKVGDDIVNLGVAKKDNKILIINSEGEVIFELCLFFDDYYSIANNFINYIALTNKFDIESVPISSSDNYYDLPTKMVLKKCTDNFSSFEENKEYEYMYFKNAQITDKVLQVLVKTSESEDDLVLSKNYLELDFNDTLHRDTNKIKNFYKYKKEYYLLNLNNNTKNKLQCNNLIYEAYYDKNNELCENILLYSNGNIPFFDTNETGCFDKDGNKQTINSAYRILDINNNFYTILEKETGKCLFLSTQKNNLIKQVEDTIFVYNSFFMINSYDYDNEVIKYQLLDQNLNEIITTYDLRFIGNNFIFIHDDNQTGYIYYYDNESIKLLDKLEEENSFYFFGINSIANSPSNSNKIKENGENIYYKVGIISYYEDEVDDEYIND